MKRLYIADAELTVGQLRPKPHWTSSNAVRGSSCGSGSNSDYSSVLKWFDKLDKYSSSESKSSYEEHTKCSINDDKQYSDLSSNTSNEQYHSEHRDEIGLEDDDDTVNELTSTELTNSLLELFDDSSLGSENPKMLQKEDMDNFYSNDQLQHPLPSYKNTFNLISNQDTATQTFASKTGFAVYYIDKIPGVDSYEVSNNLKADEVKGTNEYKDYHQHIIEAMDETNDHARHTQNYVSKSNEDEDDTLESDSSFSDNTCNDMDNMSLPSDTSREEGQISPDKSPDIHQIGHQNHPEDYEENLKGRSAIYCTTDAIDPHMEAKSSDLNGILKQHDSDVLFEAVANDKSNCSNKENKQNGLSRGNSFRIYRCDGDEDDSVHDVVIDRRTETQQKDVKQKGGGGQFRKCLRFDLNAVDMEKNYRMIKQQYESNAAGYEVTKSPCQIYKENHYDKFDYDFAYNQIDEHVSNLDVTCTQKSNVDTNDVSTKSKYSSNDQDDLYSNVMEVDATTSPHRNLPERCDNETTYSNIFTSQPRDHYDAPKNRSLQSNNEVENNMTTNFYSDAANKKEDYIDDTKNNDAVIKNSYYLNEASSDSPPYNEYANERLNSSSRFSRSNVVLLPNKNVQTFNGDRSQWKNFIETFECEIDSNEDLSNIEKMEYLESNLSGEAKKFITNFNLCKENYGMALHILKDRYGKN